MKKYFLAAALMLFAMSAHASTIRLCTGAADQPYAAAGEMISAEAKGSGLDVQVVTDTGGTWGNIKMSLDGKCDAMIAQPDGLAYLKRTEPNSAGKFIPIADLFREYLQALCSKESGVSDVGDLDSNPQKWSIALGDRGSGAWIVWQNLVAQDNSYAPVRQTDESGDLALSAVNNNQTTCMLVPAALGNSVVRSADELYGNGLQLVGVNDRDFDNATDPDGKPLYTYAKIPSGTYPKSFNYWSKVSTLTWTAKVYINKTLVTDQTTLKTFIRTVMKARGGIVSNFGS